MNPDRLVLKAATGKPGNTIRIQILLDRSSLEVFSNDGEKVLTTYIFPGTNANGISLFAENGVVTMQSLKIWDLSGLSKTGMHTR